jgi:hypothetical protein
MREHADLFVFTVTVAPWSVRWMFQANSSSPN